MERIITSHDPKHINFSYKTSIHECLMICRRHNGGDKPPTKFVSLRKMPKNAKEAIDAADAIANGNVESWGSMCRWPAKRVSAGDWTPVQWHDDNMAETTHDLESSTVIGADRNALCHRTRWPREYEIPIWSVNKTSPAP